MTETSDFPFFDSKSNNRLIVEIFTKLKDYWTAKGDTYRIRAYVNAIDLITHLSFDLTTTKRVNDLRGIGAKSKKKIKDIISTGKLEEWEKLSKMPMPTPKPEDKKTISIKEFTSLDGVGVVIANNWYDTGYREVDDVPLEICTTAQKIAIKYYHEKAGRIPRPEIAKLEKELKDWTENINIVNKTTPDNPAVKFEVCGSYRRRTPDSGDIDVMVTHRFSNNKVIMDYLVQCPIITDTLAKGDKKFRGYCILPSNGKVMKHRRIDIELVTPIQYPYALLYFTGSKNHNILMRDKARGKGWKLNEKGMHELTTNTPIIVKTEREIFDLLNVPYKEPWER